jgi:hypothetical protein
MIRNTLLVAAVVACALLVDTSMALAADPSQIGKNLENIVSPNVKSLWKIALLVGAVVTVFGRAKASLLVAFWVAICISGAVIYNPGGMAETVSSLGKSIL